MPLGRALPLGRELVDALQDVRGVKTITLAGSLRRMKETVGDIDLLVTSTEPSAVIKAFTGLRQAAEVVERGTTKAAIRHREGIQVDLRVVEPEAYGAALMYFTGGKQHNIRIREMGMKRGLKISEYGVFREKSGRRLSGASEEEVYAAVGLPWIPPELREDAGEIEAARGKQVIRAKRPRGTRPFRFPRRCPACGGLTLRPEGEAYWRCVNSACPAQLRERFGRLDRLMRAEVGQLAAVSGIGPTIAESVAKFFAESANRDVCRRLAGAGVRTTARITRQPHGPLSGKTFVLTGALRGLTRDEAAQQIRDRGGRVTDDVSRATDYAVVGAEPGTKLARARALGVPTLGEDAFLALVR